MNLLLEQLQTTGADINTTLERFVGNETLYIKFLKKFLDDSTMKQLQENIKTSQYEEAFTSAHTLKGVTGNLGLDSIYKPLIDYVQLLRDQKAEKISDELKEKILADLEIITVAYDEICRILREFC